MNGASADAHEVFEYLERDGRPLEFVVGKEYFRGELRYRVIETIETTLAPRRITVKAVPLPAAASADNVAGSA